MARSGPDAFCYAPRLENVLRKFPAVQPVIASTQREAASLAHLAQRFFSDIAARIVCSTPVLEIRDAGDVAGSRHSEILAYLDGSAADWLALVTMQACYRLTAPSWSCVMTVFKKRKNEIYRRH